MVPNNQFLHRHIVSKAKMWYLDSVSRNISGHEFTRCQNVLALGYPDGVCLPPCVYKGVKKDHLLKLSLAKKI